MRFIENGPSIPDELLLARDQGRVVFFCGAGVSRAKAELPDFWQLAKRVTNILHISNNHSVHKILKESKEIEERTGVSGLISADKIFGLLERDFNEKDIGKAVAESLKPKEAVDLSAHQTLLDLATTKESIVRLVTTNFDLLFEECDSSIETWSAPMLPHLGIDSDINGIVYLHGKVNPNSQGAERNGFVLSSSEFGRAYLTDGWATKFFKDIIEKYYVVFIGYAADDPPVNYLLEALHKSSGKLDGVYAFQSGVAEEVISNWYHKGIEAIPYDSNENHKALWDSLEQWAIRAKNPEKWHDDVINKSQGLPEKLLPHQRGQIAHIVSSIEGVRRLVENEIILSAEWLCVLDPYRRYARPGFLGAAHERDNYIDPFNHYCIDSDITPISIAEDDYYKNREVPPGSWDAFVLNSSDAKNINNNNFSAVRGHLANHISPLPSRLNLLGNWIAKISHQASAIWWASRQSSLHPDIRSQISHRLRDKKINVLPEVRRAWNYLFEYWEQEIPLYHQGKYDLDALIAQEGWNDFILRKFSSYSKPSFKVDSGYGYRPKPPYLNDNTNIESLIRLDVEYPTLINEIKVDDLWLAKIIDAMRKNLVIAFELESEAGGVRFHNICSINEDDENDKFNRSRGLSGYIVALTKLFERLIVFNQKMAVAEFVKWVSDSNLFIERLIIWAAGKQGLLSNSKFRKAFSKISDESFWNSYSTRDLLITLSTKWSTLDDRTLVKLESRLLNGPSQWEHESETEFIERKAWAVLNRITWLSQNGCTFHFNLVDKQNELKEIVPKWLEEYANTAATSFGSKGGFVVTETKYDSLLKEPLSNILLLAKELSGRQGDFLVEHDPYAGLSSSKPIRAFSALRLALKNNECPEWAWRTFLNSEARKSDKPKLMSLIAEQLILLPDKFFIAIMHTSSNWFSNINKQLLEAYYDSYKRLIDRFIDIFSNHPGDIVTTVSRTDPEPDWAMESINSPPGHIVQIIFNDPCIKNIHIDNSGFPDKWIDSIEKLLNISGEITSYSVVIISHHLNWFYGIDQQWTEKNLLSILDTDNKYTLLSGFLWRAQMPNQSLFKLLKPHLLQLVINDNVIAQKYNGILAGLLLLGWQEFLKDGCQDYLSSDEFRDVLLSGDDEFRSQILWDIERRSNEDIENTEGGWGELIVVVLKTIWPKQKIVRTPLISTRLFNLVFSTVELFNKLSDIVLPLLTTIEREHLMLPGLIRNEDEIITSQPIKVLDYLYVVLPENVLIWPYGIGDVFQQLYLADESVATNNKYIELIRKWDAR